MYCGILGTIRSTSETGIVSEHHSMRGKTPLRNLKMTAVHLRCRHSCLVRDFFSVDPLGYSCFSCCCLSESATVSSNVTQLSSTTNAERRLVESYCPSSVCTIRSTSCRRVVSPHSPPLPTRRLLPSVPRFPVTSVRPALRISCHRLAPQPTTTARAQSPLRCRRQQSFRNRRRGPPGRFTSPSRLWHRCWSRYRRGPALLWRQPRRRCFRRHCFRCLFSFHS
jgi:hypothetical protein